MAFKGPSLALVVMQRSHRSMPVVILPPLCADPEYCVVSRWNLSLPARTRWRIFGLLAAVSLTLASAFVAAGAWMVLPYSVLELGVLAFAFRYIERRAMDWERLTVAGDRVIVERCVGGTRERLLLCCAGEQWAFGAALPEQELSAVARELKRLTGARPAA